MVISTLAPKSFGETQFQNEYWISTSTNTANLGTLSNPYDGSTPAKFDGWMNSIPPNSTIHILAGIYQTYGNSAWTVKTGQKIVGSGIDVTVLQLATNAPDGTAVVSSGGYIGTNMEVCDLTCDANYTSGAYTYSGVSLGGTQNTVRRVRVINLAKYGGNSEAWGIVLQSFGWEAFHEDSTGNIIEQCEVSQFKGGGGISAISMNGANVGQNTNYISGIIRNNYVYLQPDLTNWGGFGINGSCENGILIEGNYISGADVALYGDTFGSTNVTIVNNTFKDCFDGMELQGWPRENVFIGFNNITINTNAGPYPPRAILLYDSYYTNIAVVGNTVTFDGNPPSGEHEFLYAGNVSGLLVCNNTIDSALNNYIYGSNTGINIYNNFDLNGNLIPNFNQVEPPNSEMRVTVNASTYQVSYEDKYVGIKYTGTEDITLPLAANFPGKEFIIAKEVGTSNSIVVTPPSPETINGNSYVSFNGPYEAVTCTSDGANWFTR